MNALYRLTVFLKTGAMVPLTFSDSDSAKKSYGAWQNRNGALILEIVDQFGSSLCIDVNEIAGCCLIRIDENLRGDRKVNELAGKIAQEGQSVIKPFPIKN